MQVYRIQIAALEGRVELKGRVLNSHSLLATTVELELRVVFPKETLQELRLAQMELIERIILAFFVVLFMNVEAIGGPISKVNYRLFGNVFHQ